MTSWAEVSEKVVAGQYQGLDMSDVVSCKVYISGTASGDELSVFEAKMPRRRSGSKR